MKCNQLNIIAIIFHLKLLVNSDYILFQMPIISLNEGSIRIRTFDCLNYVVVYFIVLVL